MDEEGMAGQVSSHIQVLARRKAREIQVKLKLCPCVRHFWEEECTRVALPIRAGAASACSPLRFGELLKEGIRKQEDSAGVTREVGAPSPMASDECSTFGDQVAKDKALHSMATMSSAQILSPTAFQNKMALQGLSRPPYPTPGGFWHGALPGQPVGHEDIKPFSQQSYAMQASGPTPITGYESTAGLSMSPGAPPWQGRCIASSKLRMLEFSAFLEQPQDPENFNKHLFVHIGQSNPSYSDAYLESVDVRQIYDKFPEKKGGLKDLFDKGPHNAFFLVKFWFYIGGKS
ncbi:Transcriptional enhancer factor TEF-3 [Liparis tanakae]|uniref:Transcriptional enhancer factor TEF-3 n=1 Tax=Liparis tanakae TaxID=230148 RepID=A0A4Z2G992_9TELE|nr:Transcriptional enhancer factor TEF-3 [Liparis tanakae]